MPTANPRVAERGPDSSLRYAALAFALLIAFAFQGSRGLFEPDEGRYANVAVQMLETGDYLDPRLNSGTLHFAKPPLTYWLIAGSMALFGQNEWAARLPNALAFVLTVLLVGRLGRRLVPEAPWWPALIYATLFGPVVLANIVAADTLLTLWETLAMVFAAELVLGEPLRPRRAAMLMWLAWGLAFMTKGPPGLLPLLAGTVLLAARRDGRRLGRLFHPAGLAVFAVVGLTWYVVVVLRHPELARYFVMDEVYGRVFSNEFHRNADALGILRAYAPMILLGTLPWVLFCLPRLRGLRSIATRAFWLGGAAPPAGAWLAAWILLPLAVFVVSRSRLPPYLLPLMVPAALVMARATVHRLPAWRLRAAPRALLAAWACALVGVKAFAASADHSKDARSIAAQLAREVDVAKVDELVFVEAPPYYGLHFYLGPQVDAAQLPSLPHHARAALRAPDVCSKQRSGSRQVFIVPPALRTDFAAALRDCQGLQAAQHGRAGRHEIYTVGAASGVRVAGGSPQ